MCASKITTALSTFYEGKLQEHGATPQGANYNSRESQIVRFDQLLKICDPSVPLSINDYGCGYGALLDYLLQGDWKVEYRGFDFCKPMIEMARKQHEGLENVCFFSEASQLSPADYTIACGIFNDRLDIPDSQWLEHMLATLDILRQYSQKGFAFNALTKYSDPERMRADLYYADPCMLFDHCKRHFSRNVALLHDYNLFDFTILVRL